MSRMPGNWHVRFLREPGTAMCPAYLSTPDMTNDSGVKVPCGG